MMSDYPFLHCQVCALAHRGQSDQSKTSAPFECPVTKAAGRWDWPCAPTLKEMKIVEVRHASCG